MRQETKEFKKNYNNNPNKCENCNKDILFKDGDKPSHILKRKFCSLECSREQTIRTKKIIRICIECGRTRSKNSEKCRSCYNKENVSIGERTLGSYVDGEKYLTSKCQNIRRDARIKMEKEYPFEIRKCKYCNNDEFKEVLEVHHIKGILKFELSVKIKETNSLENMIWVCPSHHAMLEKGLLV